MMLGLSSFFIVLVVALFANPCESLQCYECENSNDQDCTSMVQTCPSCMIYRSDNDPTKFTRRCCWWNCGADDTVTEFNGRQTYFCNSTDKCNGPEKDVLLGGPADRTTIATTATTPTTTVSAKKSLSQCYECSGPQCGKERSPTSSNCPSCMVFRSPNDQTQIERRCCWWNCGPSNFVQMYNGIETYFCTGDKCNSVGEESLSTPTSTTTSTAPSTLIPSTTTERRPIQCYECSGPECGKEGSPTSTNCPSCMAFRNPNDQTKIERRCCWWNCEPTNTVRMHEGIETFFCASDKCNAYGVESVLSPAVTTTTVATTTLTTTRAVVTTTFPTTTTASTSRAPTSSKCYECSGNACGKEGSTLAPNCPSCMVYRNPNDETIVERRCCWWNCGTPNTVGTYNGRETYFCVGDKCNGYGVESVLSPPVTTTTASTIPTTTTELITTTTGTCALNCQNSGIPETEDGCFCYCLENTYGRECEYIDCAKPDVDSETCSIENQPLCQESETFAFECHHLCGKC